MAINFENFIIDKVAIHQVYKRVERSFMIQPLLNDECSEFDERAKDALQERMTKALGHNSRSIKMNIVDNGGESVYSLISNFWLTSESEEEFIELSKQLTVKLAKAQETLQPSDGVIIVVKGTISEYNKDYIIFIKAEIQDGFNIIEKNGKNLLEYASNLLLTKQQKLNKIGVFINNAVRGRTINKNDLTTYIFDSNTNSSVSLSKAVYFYKNFLGLDFCQDGDVETNKFYTVAKDFINKCNVLSSTEKIVLQTNLKRYLKMNNDVFINPFTFAVNNIERQDIIDMYTSYLQKRNVQLNDIRKDLRMIDDSLKKRNILFQNSIKLEVPEEEFGQNITICEDGENTIISIRGKYVSEK